MIVKSTLEIHNKLDEKALQSSVGGAASFTGVVLQIGIIDIVFSLDSVITAIGMTNRLVIMALAVVVMMLSANTISTFIDRHSTIKILALSFLLLISVMLMGEGLIMHIPKGNIYSAMAFSCCVELLIYKDTKDSITVGFVTVGNYVVLT